MARRTPARPRRAGVALAVTAALLATGCGSGAATTGGGGGQPRHGGELTFALGSDPICIDPQQSDLTTSLNVSRQVVDSLVDQNPDTGEFVPWLASSWEVNDDATRYTFNLRDGVTFSDGTPLDAAVVKANFDGVDALGGKAIVGATYLAGYQGTEVLDRSTVRVSFGAPNAGFLHAVSTMTLGILSPKAVAVSPEARCQGTGLVGTGPFVLDHYTPKQEAVLTRRTGYQWASTVAGHQGDAYLEKITFKVVPEAGVRTGSLRSGQLDAIADVPSQDEPSLESAGYPILARNNPGTVSEYLVNNSGPILKEEAVRRAILKGVNRQEIVDTLLLPRHKPATSILSSTTPLYSDLSPLLGHDPDGARKLLDEAGWAPGPDGIRVRDGKRLTVEVVNGQAGKPTTHELVAQQLAKVGVELKITQVSRAEMLARLDNGTADLVPYGLTRGDPDALRMHFSTKRNNPLHLTESPLEAHLDAQAANPDKTQRQAAVDQAARYIVEHALAIPLVEQSQGHALGKHVHGLRFEANARLVFYDTWTGK
jgi:peptide/nickel transport system substrate-binding protein